MLSAGPPWLRMSKEAPHVVRFLGPLRGADAGISIMGHSGRGETVSLQIRCDEPAVWLAFAEAVQSECQALAAEIRARDALKKGT